MLRSRILIFLTVALGLFAGSPSASPDSASNVSAKSVAGAAAAQHEKSRNYFTDLELVTQDGDKVRFYSDVLRDRVVLINFIFTNCGDACPMATHKLNMVKNSLEGLMGNPVYFISISIDPERDTPAAMKKFAKEHNANHEGWLFLTGNPQNVNHIVKKLGQYSEDVEMHSTLMLAGNVNKRHWMKITPLTPPPIIAEKLRMLIKGS